MDKMYSIIEPLRDLSIVDLESNGFQCVDRERAAAYLCELKRSIVEALEYDRK